MQPKKLRGPKRILEVLLHGGKWPTHAMADAAGVNDNTAIKYANILKRTYPIGCERIEGSQEFRYWYVHQLTNEQKEIQRLKKIIRQIDEVLPGYEDAATRPHIALQIEKIRQQRNTLMQQIDALERYLLPIPA